MLKSPPNTRMLPIGLSVPGKASIIIDGQFGSCGKGLAASYAGLTEHFDICVTNCSPNAGHTFYDPDGRRSIAHHFSAAGILSPRSMKYLAAGSIVAPKTLLDEIERLDIDPTTVFIHPRAAVVEDCDIEAEKRTDAATTGLASTQKGGGAALARKVLREARLAGDHAALRPFCRAIDLHDLMDRGLSALIEVPQGYGLGINSGLAYPYVTSREISISSALADCQIHPAYLGRSLMCIRTFPIRVGNLVSDGMTIGASGPFWPDSREMSWESLGVEPEITTVTGRVRRVATFSTRQYAQAVSALRPDFVLLNFVNYLQDDRALDGLLAVTDPIKPVTHFGFGPKPENIVAREEFLNSHKAAA